MRPNSVVQINTFIVPSLNSTAMVSYGACFRKLSIPHKDPRVGVFDLY